MRCSFKIEKYSDDPMYKFLGKHMYDCEKEATMVVIYPNSKSDACSYHTKIEMNRSKKYDLGFAFEELQ